MDLETRIEPIAFVLNKELRTDWVYEESVEKVKVLYINFKSFTEDMLNELWLAKHALTRGGTRTAGRTKNGEQSWCGYIAECFPGGLFSKRRIDDLLKIYFGEIRPALKVEPTEESVVGENIESLDTSPDDPIFAELAEAVADIPIPNTDHDEDDDDDSVATGDDDLVTDHTKLKLFKHELQDDGRIRIEIFLPESKKIYTQFIKA